MLERLLTEKEVMYSVAEASFNSPLNRRYDLKQILNNEQPSVWQRLADDLAKPIQDYIKTEFGFEMDVSPVVPETEVIFECVKTMPYFLMNPNGNLWGIRLQRIEKAWSYFTAAYSDVLGIPRVMKYNREHPDDKASYWGLTREVSKAVNVGGNEMVNIFKIPNYHLFAYTVAHEVGHSVAHKLKVKRRDHEKFASTFGLNFMKWYESQELSPPPSQK